MQRLKLELNCVEMIVLKLEFLFMVEVFFGRIGIGVVFLRGLGCRL
jgi:hypothetical protein